jgi:hypothetical protein
MGEKIIRSQNDHIPYVETMERESVPRSGIDHSISILALSTEY